MTGITGDIAGIILAGGQGRRMGGADKALLMLHGRPLVAHVIDRLGCARAISGNGPPDRFAPFGLPVLADPVGDHRGPLAGVLAGLDWARAHGFAAIVTAATDTPGFPRDLVAILARQAAVSGAAVVIARGCSAMPGVSDTGADAALPRLQPTFGLWRICAAQGLRDAMAGGTRRIETAAQMLGMSCAEVPGRGVFFNINNLQDLAHAREIDA